MQIEKSNNMFSSIIEFFKLEQKKYTTENTLDFEEIYEDGICKLNSNNYNKMIKFDDINYELSNEEDKSFIFSKYSSFINTFSSNVSIQFCFVNQKGRNDEIFQAIHIPSKDDAFNDVRGEFRRILRKQHSKGSNEITKSMYLVVGVEAENIKQARVSLERLELDVISGLSNIGCKSLVIDGMKRLEILHNMMNIDKKINKCNLIFNKCSKKTCIAPERFNFGNKEYSKIGKSISSSSQIIINASELSDRMLAEILAVEDNLYVNFHIRPIEVNEAIKMIKRKNTDLQKMVIEEQQKAIKAGYDMDIIPSDLNTYGNDIKNLLHGLQNRDEKMFEVTIVVTSIALSKQKLDATLSQISSICNRHNCSLRKLDYQQEQALMTSLPIGNNKLKVKRNLTTSSTAVFIPFTTQELFISSKESMYYGLNALSKNLIMADRKLLKNPNGLILGTPGSGKSFSAKREIVNSILISDDDICICDPEGEYAPLVTEFHGAVIKVSTNTTDYLNPLDINDNYADGASVLKEKANFIISLLELVVGGNGLSAEEKSVIDRCLPKIYKKYFDNPIKDNMPILQDLYEMLKTQEERVGTKLATEMEIYVSGSLNIFNHRTNIDINKRLICFDIKELGNQLKKIGMLIIQDQVWNKVSKNRDDNKSTRYYIDEFHLPLSDYLVAQYFVEIWKRFRKWGGIPTGITQNVKDLLRSQEIENIFDNTDFIIMLNQASGDRKILAEKLNISSDELNYVTNSNEGEGLIFYGDTIVPFIDKFDKKTTLYKMMTTKPNEM